MRAVVVGVVLLAGCKAQPLGVHDAGVDFAVNERVDFSVPGDLAPLSTDMAVCPTGVPEICDNGCDDDGNGYTDGDDPACTTQLLVTVRTGSPNLSRLILEPAPHLAAVDGNPVANVEAFAVFNRALSPAAFVALGGATKELEIRADGGVTTRALAYTPRDVCVFNGELLVVENAPGAATPYAKIHRYPPSGPDATGSNELMPPVSAVSIFIDACASDGNALYVSRHDTTSGAVGEFVVLDKTLAVVGTVALPSGLPSGYNRCVDFAFTKRGTLIGLFTNSASGLNDPTLDGKLMAPFGFDGGLGGGYDAGVWHGVGEFFP